LKGPPEWLNGFVDSFHSSSPSQIGASRILFSIRSIQSLCHFQFSFFDYLFKHALLPLIGMEHLKIMDETVKQTEKPIRLKLSLAASSIVLTIIYF